MLLKGSPQGRMLPITREFQRRRCTQCIRHTSLLKPYLLLSERGLSQMHRLQTRKANRAFTLVELLVVVLILAILMAVALPLYLGAIRNSEKGAARANMQTIANANQSHKLQSGNYTSVIADLAPDLGGPTVNGPGTRIYTITLNATEAPGNPCDSNGDGTTATTEVIPAGGFSVQSTEGTDGCFIPGISSR